MKLLKYSQLFLECIVITLFYLAIGVYLTYPLIGSLTSEVPNNLYPQAEHTFEWGDHLQVMAGFLEHGYILETLSEGERPLVKELCYSALDDCRMSNFDIIKNAVFSPYWGHTILYFITGDEILAYNLSVLASFILVGLSGYFLSSYLTSKTGIANYQKKAPAFTSSLILVMAHYRVHHLLVGHKLGWLTFLLPLLFLITEKILRGGLSSRSKLMLKISGIILLIYLAFTEQILLMYSFIYIGLRLAWHSVFEAPLFSNFNAKRTITRLLKYGWVGIALILSLAISLQGKLQSIGDSAINEGRDYAEVSLYSPHFSDLLEAPIFEHELNIYIGLRLLLLLVSALIIVAIFAVRGTTKTFKSSLAFHVVLFIVFFVLTLGSTTPVYEYLYEYVPVFKFSRTPSRAFIPLLTVIMILITLIQSYFLAKLNQNKVRNLWGNLLIIFFGAVIFTTYMPKNDISLTILPVEVQKISENDKVLFLPFTEPGHFFGSVVEYQLAGKKAVSLNGYTPFPSQEDIEFAFNSASLNNGSITESELSAIIAKYGITKIVIFPKYFQEPELAFPGKNRTGYTNTGQKLNDLGNVELSEATEDYIVYEVID